MERKLFVRDTEAIKILIETSSYKKPYLSCEEQLILLEYRGVKIENKKICIRAIRNNIVLLADKCLFISIYK
ncbi:hypothetical protein LHK26_12235 [Staphylococcus argenteus]|nr:hypothetical protein [Staphylococcus argenteus]